MVAISVYLVDHSLSLLNSALHVTHFVERKAQLSCIQRPIIVDIYLGE
jgi:hypothetical protein